MLIACVRSMAMKLHASNGAFFHGEWKKYVGEF